MILFFQRKLFSHTLLDIIIIILTTTTTSTIPQLQTDYCSHWSQGCLDTLAGLAHNYEHGLVIIIIVVNLIIIIIIIIIIIKLIIIIIINLVIIVVIIPAM